MPKIDQMYAWICTEPDGGEGIPAIEKDNRVLPLVGADMTRMESLRPYALQVAKDLPVKLVRFHNIEILEQL